MMMLSKVLVQKLCPEKKALKLVSNMLVPYVMLWLNFVNSASCQSSFLQLRSYKNGTSHDLVELK